ncbi:hypothetical protein U9M48_004870 [Paspalum notatum var. saurae]|uniref:Uncharacterized protein n=1 Tax=Paspalum notatum var. saurae TaxID=547442 RepID=A0AAQ3SF41_PASNO
MASREEARGWGLAWPTVARGNCTRSSPLSSVVADAYVGAKEKKKGRRGEGWTAVYPLLSSPGHLSHGHRRPYLPCRQPFLTAAHRPFPTAACRLFPARPHPSSPPPLRSPSSSAAAASSPPPSPRARAAADAGDVSAGEAGDVSAGEANAADTSDADEGSSGDVSAGEGECSASNASASSTGDVREGEDAAPAGEGTAIDGGGEVPTEALRGKTVAADCPCEEEHTQILGPAFMRAFRNTFQNLFQKPDFIVGIKLTFYLLLVVH